MAKGIVNIQKVPTENNPADVGTKIVTAAKFKHCLGLLHVEVCGRNNQQE